MTEEENVTWIIELREEKELERQLEVIRTRILADTSVYVKRIGDRVILNTDSTKSIGLCRPLLIIEGNYIDISNDTDVKTVENFVKELTTERIKQLKVADEKTAKALFGQNGWCGVILMTTTNRRSKKILLRYKV